MAYNGTTPLLSGIIQQSGDYPLVHAHAVYVDDNTRLDEVIGGEGVATVADTIEYLFGQTSGGEVSDG